MGLSSNNVTCTTFLWQNNFQSKKAAAQASGSTKGDDEIFYEAVGGYSKKGTFFGLGNSAGNYFTRPGKSITNDISTPSSSIVSQLKGQLESTTSELTETNQKLSDALNKIEVLEKDEKRNKEMILELQKKFSEFSQSQA